MIRNLVPNNIQTQRYNFEKPLAWDWTDHYSYADQRQAQKLVRRTCALVPQDAASVLDVGCGSGQLVRALNDRDIPRVACLDYSQEALRRAVGWRTLGRAECLPYARQSFDAVTCTEVIEHHQDAIFGHALAELARVAKKYIVISVPYRENLRMNQVPCPRCGTWFHSSGHQRSFSEEGLSRLFPAFHLHRLELVGEEKIYLFKRPLRGLIRSLRGKYALPPTSTCPKCGYEEWAGPSSPQPKRYYNLRALFTKIAPRYRRPAWYLALYKRA